MTADARSSVLIFDLDGTLVDSAPDIAASVDYALSKINREIPDGEMVRSYIGNGVDRLIHRSLTFDINGVAEQNTFEIARSHFFEFYQKNVCRHSVLYPGVRDALQAFHDEGYGLACVTNKPIGLAAPLLDELGIGRLLTPQLGGDSLAEKKPSPRPLLHVAEHYGIPAGNCVMIGDSLTDVLAARNAGMPVVCVNYGYGDVVEMRAHEPDAMVGRFADIPALLAQGLTARVQGVGA